MQCSFGLLVVFYMLFGSMMFMILEGDLIFEHEPKPYSDTEVECLRTVRILVQERSFL